STLTRYTVIVLGFLIALAAAGIELSKVAIVAGGLSVGIGFGLQTVVSNFVSGLILLFERPLKVGDDIQLGGLTGEIRRIGIRASSLRTDDGAEVILPNSKLISEAVTNWTFKHRRRRIEVSLKLNASIDADQVVEALLDVAREHPSILPHPAPRASLIKFDVSGLEFVLGTWISEFRDEVAVRSELNGAIQRKFAEAGIIEPLRGFSASRDSVAAK
nr:mechanosensitive ion channel [Kiloniellales bacterium]